MVDLVCHRNKNRSRKNYKGKAGQPTLGFIINKKKDKFMI